MDIDEAIDKLLLLLSPNSTIIDIKGTDWKFLYLDGNVIVSYCLDGTILQVSELGIHPVYSIDLADPKNTRREIFKFIKTRVAAAEAVLTGRKELGFRVKLQ